MWKLAFGIIALLRILVPFSIFFHPVAATAASIILDSLDGYMGFRAGMTHRGYHTYDKLMDYWWYMFILLYSVDLSIFPVIFILFVYRTAGQIVSLTLQKRSMLFWFPNILEHFFIAYLLATIFPIMAPLVSDRLQPLALSICFAIAMTREYWLHVKNKSVTQDIWGIDFDWRKNEPR